jgi:hypothetical protein
VESILLHGRKQIERMRAENEWKRVVRNVLFTKLLSYGSSERLDLEAYITG